MGEALEKRSHHGDPRRKEREPPWSPGAKRRERTRAAQAQTGSFGLEGECSRASVWSATGRPGLRGTRTVWRGSHGLQRSNRVGKAACERVRRRVKRS